MGMFDFIACRAPLPDNWNPPKHNMQTKDMECILGYYEITAEGKLLLTGGCWDDGIRKIIRTIPYHGWLNFYGTEGTVGSDNYQWHEYWAKFTDGQLVEIVMDQPEG